MIGERAIVRAVRIALAPFATRVANMVARGIVSLADDAQKLQLVQLGLLDGETRDGCERVQNYGFSSVPLPGAVAATVFVGGRRDHPLVVAVDDPRYRPTAMKPGESAQYNHHGDYIKILDGRIIEVVAGAKVEITAPEVVVHASTKVELDTPLTEITGDVTVAGSLDVVGPTSLDATLEVAGASTLAAVSAAAISAASLASAGAVSGSTLSDGVSNLGALRSTFNTHTHPENGEGGGTTSVPNQLM